MAEPATAKGHTLLTHPLGLHARPAVRIAQLAARFQAEIFIRVDDRGEWLSARSAAQVMRLQARPNSVLCFRAEGEDAREAVLEMVSLVDRDFLDSPEGEWTVSAVIASAGLASGKLWHYPVAVKSADSPTGTPEAETARLRQALDAAGQSLEALAAAQDEPARKILALQLSLLRDEGFLAPVHQCLAAGNSALQAWRALMEAEIAVYREAGDEYLRARALDLQDLQQRVAEHLTATSPGEVPPGDILLAAELWPSRFLALPAEQLRGIILTQGSRISHVATLARQRGIPMLVSPRLDVGHLTAGTEVVLDAEAGQLIANPRVNTVTRYTKTLAIRAMESAVSEQFLSDPGLTSDGEAVQIYLDVDELTALDSLNPAHCDGIGWVRSEALFSGELPDELTQYRRYQRLLDWAQGRPVCVALAQTGNDGGGGRAWLQHAERFRPQLRALCELAAKGDLRVLLPGVRDPDELQQAQAQFREVLAELDGRGKVPSLGLLLAAPVAVLGLKRFTIPMASVDLDRLLVHLLALADGEVADLSHPVVLAMLRKLVKQSAVQGAVLSVAGQCLLRPGALGALIGCGIRRLVVPPLQLARAKAALAEL